MSVVVVAGAVVVEVVVSTNVIVVGGVVVDAVGGAVGVVVGGVVVVLSGAVVVKEVDGCVVVLTTVARVVVVVVAVVVVVTIVDGWLIGVYTAEDEIIGDEEITREAGLLQLIKSKIEVSKMLKEIPNLSAFMFCLPSSSMRA